jgi:hypothetical protein
MFSHYATRALGTLLGGDEGQELIAKADAELTNEGVRAPERWTRIWVDPS